MRALTSLSVAGGCCVGLVALIVNAQSWPTVEAEPFSRNAWHQGAALSAVQDPGCVRGGMALDLLEKGRLLGLTQAEVIDLLGTPADQAREWRYALGQCSGFGWSHSELRISFDNRGKAMEVKFEHAS